MPTNIQWTDETWNPWQGCHPVSTACDNCYMYREMFHYGKDPRQVVLSSKKTFEKPLSLKPGTWVFTCSWSDFFHEAADQWRANAWNIIRNRPDLCFIILTKRPERIAECLPSDWGSGWKNVILGITAEDQWNFNLRWQILELIPAAHYVISHEPNLGLIQYPPNFLSLGNRAWVITGGETGDRARPSHALWFRNDRDQCHIHNVPFFFKHWGEWIHGIKNTNIIGDGAEFFTLHNDLVISERTAQIYRWAMGGASVKLGKTSTGRMLDGREFNDLPQVELIQLQTSLL